MDEPQPRNDVRAREALEEAVRCLATSDDDLTTRVRTCVRALTKLTAEDFPDPDEHELLTRIQRRTYELALAEARQQANGTSASAEAASSSTLEAIAGEILDLREAMTGRALRRARHEGETPRASR